MKLFRRIPSRLGLFAVAMIFVIPAVQAQTHQLDEVFVTANRIGQSVESISSEVDTLSKYELQTMGNANLSQALATLPGFQSTAYGQHSVYLRGTDSRMTSLYVEGIRIESHDGTRLGGGVPWEMLPLEMVDHMEVVRGPSSSLYGSDAMGGVVQLFTKSGANNDKPQLSQSFGSYGFRQTTGQVSGKKEAFDYSIQFSTNASNGYDTRPDMTHTPGTEDSAKHFGMVKLGYDLNPVHRVEWVVFKTIQSYRSVPYSGTIDITNHNHITGTKVEWQTGWDANNLSRLRYSRSEVTVDSDEPNSNGSDVAWNYKTTTSTASFDHEWMTSVGKLTGLLERKQDQFKADLNTWNSAIDADRSQNALGLGYSLKQAEHLVNASVRADNYSSFGTHASYSLSYGYEFQPEWTIMAIQATGFRAPTLEQIYGIYGSTTLTPETNISNELALQYKRNKSSARISLFENKITDLITGDSNTSIYYNVDKVKIQGISLSGKTQVSDVNLQSSLDLLNPVYDSGTYAGNQLSLRSKQAMHFSADKVFDETRAGVELQYVGKRFDNAANTVELPSYGLVNLWSKTGLNSEWSWINRIDNLFNKTYQQYGCGSTSSNCNYVMPGVTFFTSVQWQPR